MLPLPGNCLMDRVSNSTEDIFDSGEFTHRVRFVNECNEQTTTANQIMSGGENENTT